jgi:WD40 repeat protein
MKPAPFRITSLDVSSNGRTLAAAGHGASSCGPEAVALWDLRSGEHRAEVSTCPATDVSFTPDGNYLAVTELVDAARVHDVHSGVGVSGLGSDGYSFSRARFSPDGTLLAISEVNLSNAVRPNLVVTWAWEPRTLVSRIPAGPDTLLDFDPTGPRVALLGRQGQVEVWEVRGPRRLLTLEGRPGRMSDLAYSPDGRIVATAGDDGVVRLFDARTGRQRLVLGSRPCGFSQLAFSPDGSRLATSSSCDGLRIWALDLDDLLRIAQKNVTRSLTAQECRLYLHADSCPGR